MARKSFKRRVSGSPKTFCTIRTCMLHHSSPHAVCEVMGPTRPYDPTWLRNFIAQGTSNDKAFQAAIYAEMMSTGHCLWHAAAVVLGTRCSCALCSNPNDVRYGRMERAA